MNFQQTKNFAFFYPQRLSHFCNVKENLFIHYLMSKYLFTLVFLFAAQLLVGQGWERIYSGGGQDEAYSVAVTPEGGYVLTGVYNTSLLMIKVDVDGFLQWSKINQVSGTARGRAIAVTSDNHYLVAGSIGQDGPNKDALLMKTDNTGQVIWTKNLGITGKDDINSMVVLEDGSIVMTGSVSDDGGQMRIFKTDAQGNLLWSQNFGLVDYKEVGYGITVTANGDIVAVGERSKTDNKIYVVRLNAAGTLQWENTYSIVAGESGQSIVETANGGLVIAGSTRIPNTSFQQGLLLKITGDGSPIPAWLQTFSSNAQILNDVENDGTGGFIVTGRTPEIVGVQNETYIARISAQGSLIWENSAGKLGLSEGLAVSRAINGGFVAVGYASTSTSPFQPQRYAYMVRTDADGNIFTNYLKGNIYLDQNDDCTYQTSENTLKNWLIRISSPDFTRYVTTDADGEYFIMVDTGEYDIKVFTPNNYWGTCAAEVSATVTDFYDTLTTNIGAKRLETCPYNEVDIQTPILRRCVDNTYTVRYCNSGTVASPLTKVVVEKSPDFTITSASLPFTQTGDSLTFNIGVLNAGDCGSFTINAFLDCDVELTSAHCMRAHISPDTFCANTSAWDGAIIEAKARCENGRVKLSVTNKGIGPTTNELEYVIIDDLVVLFTIPTETYTGIIASNLEVGIEKPVYDIPATGHTYRIITEQTSGYPGMSVPTAAIEGCQTDTTTSVSTSFFTMFPEDDAEPFDASDCQETNESDFNPTFLKRGHPKGYKEPHYIKPNTDIDYLIRFVNTGSDTVHQVIIRDTLSPWLDPTTVRPGTASHAYTYSVYGDGIVQFKLSNINLLSTGSNLGEGFVKFRVSQKPDVPCASQVLNQAAIYFDANAPMLSNETMHTVCDTFLESVLVHNKDIYFPGADLRIYPNPFVESTTFEVTGIQADLYHFELYDVQGRQVFNHTYSDSIFQLFRLQIPSGVLFYRLSADGRPVASGRILAR